MKLIKLKAVLAAVLAGGTAAWGQAALPAEDAPEEEVVAFGEAEFWLGGDEVAVASGEGEFWLGPDEIVEASAEASFWLGPEGQPTGESAWLVQTDAGSYIVGEGKAEALPNGFDRNSITSVVVGDGITEIGARFFKKCRKLNTATLGKDVVKVNEKAFYLCLDLEKIVVENPDALESLKDAIVYQTAIDPDGKPYPIPFIEVLGYKNVLYGTVDLVNPDWQPVPDGTKMEESGYHFFKYVLEEE